MIEHRRTCTTFAIVLSAIALAGTAPAIAQEVELSKIGGYNHGGFATGAAEISAYDAASQKLFVVNAEAVTIDILDISDPTSPTLSGTIDATTYGGSANSVAVRNGVVAVAIENTTKQNDGVVAFFETSGSFISAVTVGALPDMVTFTPNGKYVLVANEGEPNASYTIDPPGTVSIIDMRGGAENLTQADVRSVGFAAFNGATLDPSVRVFGPNATVAQDFEPEYIAISHDSKTAWVTLQENNALAVIDIKSGNVTSIAGLGFKDHSLAANALDASDRDNMINIATWPVHGMFLPDAIASFKHQSETYLILANEGDARDYAGFGEELRVGQVVLDPTAFPNSAVLKANANLGRLRITNTMGDTDSDGDYDRLYSFGARSFSIRDSRGMLVYDSGDELERITAQAYPTQFNSTNDANNSFDSRSDDKGPEAEGVAVGKAFGRTYAFIALERIGGLAVYNIEDPASPAFVQYVTTRDFTGNASLGTAGDLAPEGVLFIGADESPTGEPLVVVANEISGTTAIFSVTQSEVGGNGMKIGLSR